MRFSLKSIVISVIALVLCVTVIRHLNVVKTDLYMHPESNDKSNDLLEWTNELGGELEKYNQKTNKNLLGEEVQTGEAPNVIHFVWCTKRPLEFHHYIGILSAWKFLKPSRIEFHHYHDVFFLFDRYNLWLQDLQETIPGFATRKIEVLPGNCGVPYATSLLLDKGGMYISNSIVLFKPLGHFHQRSFTFAVNKHLSDISFLISKPKDEKLRVASMLLHTKDLEIDLFTNTIMCDVIQPNRLLGTDEESVCAELPVISHTDILLSNTHIARIARKLLFESSDPVVAKSVLPGLIPKYVHLVSCQQKPLNFMNYLSLRSVFTILQPEKIFIHGTNLPEGEFFANFSRDQRIIHEYNSCGGSDAKMSDKARDQIKADALLKYGGIYMDWDVIWVRPVDDLFALGYDTILNFDHVYRSGFPNILNMHIIMAKPKSHFIQKWKKSFDTYSDVDTHRNSLDIPYKLYEKHTRDVHIERHLDVKCIMMRCFPKFGTGTQNVHLEIPFDWRTDIHAIRISDPVPLSFHNATMLDYAYDIFSGIGKFIMRQQYNGGV